MAHRDDLRVVAPLGVFRAVATRDAAALARDGQTYFAANDLSSAAGSQYEILFADGQWMLAAPEDLEP